MNCMYILLSENQKQYLLTLLVVTAFWLCRTGNVRDFMLTGLLPLSASDELVTSARVLVITDVFPALTAFTAIMDDPHSYSYKYKSTLL